MPSEKDLENITKRMIDSQMTYKEASEIYNIPISTLWERNHGETLEKIDTNNELKNSLELVADANRRKQTVEMLSERNQEPEREPEERIYYGK